MTHLMAPENIQAEYWPETYHSNAAFSEAFILNDDSHAVTYEPNASLYESYDQSGSQIPSTWYNGDWPMAESSPSAALNTLSESDSTLEGFHVPSCYADQYADSQTFWSDLSCLLDSQAQEYSHSPDDSQYHTPPEDQCLVDQSTPPPSSVTSSLENSPDYSVYHTPSESEMLVEQPISPSSSQAVRGMQHASSAAPPLLSQGEPAASMCGNASTTPQFCDPGDPCVYMTIPRKRVLARTASEEAERLYGGKLRSDVIRELAAMCEDADATPRPPHARSQR
ncbi:hypothetical protein WOLCODRAFT_163878 [Wolfiporia cocos MD-104 SS10]|uniref:Uncharacterized protein n=1 Tax=Wolfiporia cocos (strain MD-104) TaxID=742152 RepID=A0A2H3JXH9_WOLCO|nr:hypothetical protein WOLCODRAFT_163878 [Wolfiporia cocos MD-104 SS10]